MKSKIVVTCCSFTTSTKSLYYPLKIDAIQLIDKVKVLIRLGSISQSKWKFRFQINQGNNSSGNPAPTSFRTKLTVSYHWLSALAVHLLTSIKSCWKSCYNVLSISFIVSTIFVSLYLFCSVYLRILFIPCLGMAVSMKQLSYIDRINSVFIFVCIFCGKKIEINSTKNYSFQWVAFVLSRFHSSLFRNSWFGS